MGVEVGGEGGEGEGEGGGGRERFEQVGNCVWGVV